MFDFLVFLVELASEEFVFFLLVFEELFDFVNDFIGGFELLESVLVAGFFAVEGLFEQGNLAEGPFE